MLTLPPLFANWVPVPHVKSAYLLPYDIQRFPFARWLAKELFRVPCLESMHESYLRFKQSRNSAATLGYDDNLRLRAMMQRLGDESSFYSIYRSFVTKVVAPEFGRNISYSHHPKMRVHLAGTDGVSLFHHDADVTGRPEQINVWLPFTNTSGGNTLWIESDYDRGDHQPVDVAYGQALLFDGGLLSHGTVANDTSVTRVSLDLRFAVRSEAGQKAEALIFQGRPGQASASD